MMATVSPHFVEVVGVVKGVVSTLLIEVVVLMVVLVWRG